MTANHALPMSQKQADALRREWALLLKMGYASQWTPAQKMARQEEIATLLLQAGQALPRGMTRQELLASVPIRNAEGGRYYVDLADIPQPWRDEFWAALHGSGRPIVEGVERAAYAWDWEGWVCGQAFGDPAVSGKQRGGDLRAGKKTWLLIRGLELERSLGGGALTKAIGQMSIAREVSDMVEALIALGVREESEELIRGMETEALAALDSVDVPAERKAPLRALAMGLMGRTS